MQENEKVRIDLMKKLQTEATSSSLGESVKNLSQAITGLNSIKEQYAGSHIWNNLFCCFLFFTIIFSICLNFMNSLFIVLLPFFTDVWAKSEVSRKRNY